MLVGELDAELDALHSLELLVLVAFDADAKVVALRNRFLLGLLGRRLVRLVCW